MRYDVTTLGELVIDLVPIETPAGLAYLPKPGGAPGNVAAGVARLGHASAMITKVGTEAFGEAAVSALEAAGVATHAVIRTADHNTALAVVSKTASGETDFFFYRENCADSNLTAGGDPGRSDRGVQHPACRNAAACDAHLRGGAAPRGRQRQGQRRARVDGPELQGRLLARPRPACGTPASRWCARRTS